MKETEYLIWLEGGVTNIARIKYEMVEGEEYKILNPMSITVYREVVGENYTYYNTCTPYIVNGFGNHSPTYTISVKGKTHTVIKKSDSTEEMGVLKQYEAMNKMIK